MPDDAKAPLERNTSFDCVARPLCFVKPRIFLVKDKDLTLAKDEIVFREGKASQIRRPPSVFRKAKDILVKKNDVSMQMIERAIEQ